MIILHQVAQGQRLDLPPHIDRATTAIFRKKLTTTTASPSSVVIQVKRTTEQHEIGHWLMFHQALAVSVWMVKVEAVKKSLGNATTASDEVDSIPMTEAMVTMQEMSLDRSLHQPRAAR
jgi:hypothetical protein